MTIVWAKLNGCIRALLARSVRTDRAVTAAEMFRLMDAVPGRSRGKRWTREELHRRSA